jgi:proteasome lid subunit RPN8/RPN11
LLNEMSEAVSEHGLKQWSVPGCPFIIEYSPRVFDDIRLAVVDAFCSLPRGGAEIGGLLMGRWDDGRVRIAGYAPLECEHAHGPSFTLSANDEARLRELMDRSTADFPGLLPVGWYHSHTRSEIFLSEADLAIHDRYFPEPWQVALVLKPHTLQPTRAGFFFRDSSGKIHATESYQEFAIEALPMYAPPSGAAAVPPPLEQRPRVVRLERNPSIGVPAAEPESAPPPPPPPPAPPAQRVAREDPEPAPEPAPAASRETPVPEPPPPQFLLAQSAPSRPWGKWLLLVLVSGAAGAGGYYTRAAWLPRLLSAVQPAPAVPGKGQPLGLSTLDRDGQLQIGWDRHSMAVRRSVDATLEISDGAMLPQSITLDQDHLENGSFTYARQNERVDIKLTVHPPNGRPVSDSTTFLGKLPPHPPATSPAEDPAVRQQREAISAETKQLKTDLEREAARTRRLEKDIQSVRDELRKEQQRRMVNQAGTDR